MICSPKTVIISPSDSPKNSKLMTISQKKYSESPICVIFSDVVFLNAFLMVDLIGFTQQNKVKNQAITVTLNSKNQ
jgi:hypothetical protein